MAGEARILLIDDMPDVRKSIRMVLKRAGHEIEEAENGREGIEKAKSGKFDLVITDMLMPEADGGEVVQAIRRQGRTPVLAVSGGGMQVSPDGALELAEKTADATLKKPFSREDLLQAVNGLLGKQ